MKFASFIIGQTTTKKIMKAASFIEDGEEFLAEFCASFSEEELFELYAVFEYLSVQEAKRALDSPFVELYRLQGDFIKDDLLSQDSFEEIKNG